MGRPQKNIDEEAVAELAFAGCSTNEIALIVGCDDQTLHRRLAKVIAKNEQCAGSGSVSSRMRQPRRETRPS
jgi:DNA invertase Pin-like site-specific DNA recombinase